MDISYQKYGALSKDDRMDIINIMKNTPKHIVLFLDGNRRWAKERGLPAFQGHYQGYKNIVNICQWGKSRGVNMLTAFGFSTENWNRSAEEVTYLMKLLEKGLLESLETFKKDRVRVRIIGQRDRLPKPLQDAIERVERETQEYGDFHLNLAVSYGGRWDILQAVRRIAGDGIDPQKIDEPLFESYLSTAGQPAPDLVIRPGGEMRLSNFLLWQISYAELYFSKKMWPEFSEEDLAEALEEFDRRTRRFGK
jgi:undecaprenyl diphosphate synthase